MKKPLRLIALAVSTVAAAPALAAADGTGGEKDGFVRVDEKVVIEGTEFKFKPDRLEVPVGEKIAIILANEGVVAHNLKVVKDGAKTDDPMIESIQKGDRETLEVSFSQTGEYRFFCNVPGHKQAGMTGLIRVVEK